MLNKIAIALAGLALVVGLVSVSRTSKMPAYPIQVYLGQNQNAGSITNQIGEFTNGIKIGDGVLFHKSGVIGPTENEGFWRNNTGRIVYVSWSNFGWETGTASSSLIFFVATSTVANLTSDYTQPAGNLTLVATVATSSAPVMFTSTSTALGFGTLPVPDGAYLNFQVQERFGCKTVGKCETATSTNRGISNFVWYFSGRYTP